MLSLHKNKGEQSIQSDLELKQNPLSYILPFLLEQELSTSITTEVRKALGGPGALITGKSLCHYFHKYYKDKGLLKSSQNQQQSKKH